MSAIVHNACGCLR